MIIAEQISYPHRLLDQSFSICKGMSVHILGANGSGKTTLLTLLGGLLQGDGRISLEGECLSSISLSSLAKKRALLNQQQHSGFNIGVYQYLQLCLSHCNTLNKTHVESVVKTVTQRLHLDDKLSRALNQLSGGEWQRVRLAGACLQVWPSLNPDACLLLLDEPATGLDVSQQENLYALLREMKTMGITLIQTNHDINRAFSDADKVLILKEGQLIADGTPVDVMTTSSLMRTFGVQFEFFEHKEKRIAIAV